MSECFCRCHTTCESGDCEHCRLVVTPVTFKCPAYGPVAVGDIKKFQDDYSCSWPIGRYIGKVDAVDGDMIEVKLDPSIPTNIGEFVKLYGVSGHVTVPIPSEGQIKPLGGPTLESIPIWGVKSWDEPYPWSWYDVPEARLFTTKSRKCGWATYKKDLDNIQRRLDSNGNIYYVKPLLVDDTKYYGKSSLTPLKVMNDIIGYYSDPYTIEEWKGIHLAQVKKPFNSEGSIK